MPRMDSLQKAYRKGRRADELFDGFIGLDIFQIYFPKRDGKLRDLLLSP
jgi:hypothetical protein